MATIRTRKQSDGTSRYMATIRIRKRKTIIYQEYKTFALRTAAVTPTRGWEVKNRLNQKAAGRLSCPIAIAPIARNQS